MLSSINQYINEDTEQLYSQDSDRLMTRKEAAVYIGFAAGTLAVWDCIKRYDLKPVKIGRSVRYRKSELDRFLDEAMKPE